jgi:Protein of unknown function (DUF2586)
MLPDATIDLQDGRLGSVPADSSGAHVILGISSLGTPNTLYQVQNVPDVKAKAGVGPLAESAAKKVRRGIRPVFVMPLAIATPGAAGAVTQPNVTAAQLAIAGASKDSYELIVLITRAALTLAANTAAFKYSLDGGDTFSDEIAMPVSGIYAGLALETGLTLTWTDGTGASFVVGNTYKSTVSEPQANTVGLAAAMDAILAIPDLDIEGIHVAAPLTAAQAAVISTKIDSARAAYRFWWWVGEARVKTDAETIDAWKAALIADYVNTFHRWGNVVAADAEVLSELTARIDHRNPASEMLAHALGGAVSQSPGEVARGVVPGVLKLHHNEGSLEGLSTKFWTMRTYEGMGGFYVTDGKTLAPVTSDYQQFENVRTINKVARAARVVGIKYVNSRFRVNADGTLNGKDLAALTADFQTPLDAMVNAGDLSGYNIIIDPAQNILSTKIIYVDVDCIPVGIARNIRVRIGYINPRLVVPEAAAAAANPTTPAA